MLFLSWTRRRELRFCILGSALVYADYVSFTYRDAFCVPPAPRTWPQYLNSYLTSVLGITLGKVIQYWVRHGRSHLLDIFLRYVLILSISVKSRVWLYYRDGVHFFAVTASSNIVNVVYMKSKINVDGHMLSGSNFVRGNRLQADLVERRYWCSFLIQNSALALIINSMMVSRLIIVSI